MDNNGDFIHLQKKLKPHHNMLAPKMIGKQRSTKNVVKENKKKVNNKNKPEKQPKKPLMQENHRVMTSLGMIDMNQLSQVNLISSEETELSYPVFYHFSTVLQNCYAKLFVEDCDVLESTFHYVDKVKDLELKLWSYVHYVIKHNRDEKLSVSVFMELVGRSLNMIEKFFNNCQYLKSIKDETTDDMNKEENVKSIAIYKRFIGGFIKLNAMGYRLINNIIHETFHYLQTHMIVAHNEPKAGTSFIPLRKSDEETAKPIDEGLTQRLQIVCKKIKSEIEGGKKKEKV